MTAWYPPLVSVRTANGNGDQEPGTDYLLKRVVSTRPVQDQERDGKHHAARPASLRAKGSLPFASGVFDDTCSQPSGRDIQLIVSTTRNRALPLNMRS